MDVDKQRALLFKNAPKRARCKQCQKTYPNPVLNGCGIVFAMCQECRRMYIGKPKKRKATKTLEKPIEKIEIKEEELKTLKEYLEMKI